MPIASLSSTSPHFPHLPAPFLQQNQTLSPPLFSSLLPLSPSSLLKKTLSTLSSLASRRLPLGPSSLLSTPNNRSQYEDSVRQEAARKMVPREELEEKALVSLAKVLLRETLGFDAIMSILKLRGSSYSFTQQKTINLLSALETINLLLMGGSESDPGKDTNKLTNRTVLVQNKMFDYLLLLGVESQWAPIPVSCAALRCIADLIVGHPKNLDTLSSKVLGEEPQVEPALNSILRIILRTSSAQEFIEADHVFKSFCEVNSCVYHIYVSNLN